MKRRWPPLLSRSHASVGALSTSSRLSICRTARSLGIGLKSPLNLWQDGRELKLTHTLSFDRPGFELSSVTTAWVYDHNRNFEASPQTTLPPFRPETFRTALLPLKLPASSSSGFGGNWGTPKKLCKELRRQASGALASVVRRLRRPRRKPDRLAPFLSFSLEESDFRNEVEAAVFLCGSIPLCPTPVSLHPKAESLRSLAVQVQQPNPKSLIQETIAEAVVRSTFLFTAGP